MAMERWKAEEVLELLRATTFPGGPGRVQASR
jgi:hypothetical protein